MKSAKKMSQPHQGSWGGDEWGSEGESEVVSTARLTARLRSVGAIWESMVGQRLVAMLVVVSIWREVEWWSGSSRGTKW